MPRLRNKRQYGHKTLPSRRQHLRLIAFCNRLINSLLSIFLLHRHSSQVYHKLKIQIMNLYVSNLDYSVQDDALKTMFTNYGTVTSAKVILDRTTGKSR